MSRDKNFKSALGPEYLFNFLKTFYELLVIKSGIDLDLYDIINQHKIISSEELSSLKIPEKLINSWCNAATAIGHLKMKNNDYTLSSFSKNYLCKDSPSYFGFIVQNIDYLLSIYQSIKEIFNGNFLEMSGSRAIEVIKAIAPIADFTVPFFVNEIPKLKDKCDILDLGCGLGNYLVKLAKINPQIQGTGVEGGWGIEVVNEAKKHVLQNNLENRIQIIYSNVLDFETEEKYDVIIMSNFLQAFQKKEGEKILNKSYNWLKETGTIAIQDNFLDNNRLSPQFNALFDFYLNLESPNARIYSFQEIYEILQNVGFVKIRKTDILFGMSHIIANKES